MASWLDAVTNPLSAATKTLQELMEVRDLVKFGDTFRKLNSEILAAQSSALSGYQRELALLEEKRSLEAKVASFEEWETEKQRYDLKVIGFGTYAYMLKPDARHAEPPHWVCVHCYRERKIEVIQYGIRVTPKGTLRGWACPSCKNGIEPRNEPHWIDDNA